MVQLQGNFLELLTVAEPDLISPTSAGSFGFGAFNRDFLERREGFSMLVLQSDDARQDQAEFAAKGLSDYAPFDFSRSATLPDGSTAKVAFSLAFVTHPEMPEAAFFTCQQHAPELFWKAAYQRHENGAQVVSEAIMVAEEPERYAGFLRALHGEEAVGQEAGRLTASTTLGRLCLLTPARFTARFPGSGPIAGARGPHFAAYRVVLSDRDSAVAMWQRNALPLRQNEHGHFLPASEGHGVVIEFTGPEDG